MFVEKPLCLDPAQSKRLAELAAQKSRANQVGYHNRFIGTFQETRRLVRAGAVGDVYHISGSAFGQVVIRAKSGSTWRSKKAEGGGCLHDYASHVVDLMNFIVGPPEKVVGAQMQSIFSKDVEDAVYAQFRYKGGATGQLETNWSDETYRKMSTTIVVYGTKGKIVADRRVPRLPQGGRPFREPDAGRVDEPLHHRAAGARELLPARRGVLRADRRLRERRAASGDTSSFASAYQTDLVVDEIMKLAEASR